LSFVGLGSVESSWGLLEVSVAVRRCTATEEGEAVGEGIGVGLSTGDPADVQSASKTCFPVVSSFLRRLITQQQMQHSIMVTDRSAKPATAPPS
jgi:hypothetical protein